MRTILFSVLLLCTFNYGFATDYYFSSTSGVDSRSASQASSSATPWKTINKLNAIFSTLLPGDRILFKRGDIFYGSIIIKKSGTSTKPITLGAYGTGNRPVITGFTTLTNWISIGSGKYESLLSSMGSSVNIVTLNDVAKEMGRYPNSNAANKGYLTFETAASTTITDKELTSSTNWTGSEVVIRTHHWLLDRVKATSHSGTTVQYSPLTTGTPQNGYGYFFQNDIRALDQMGEWCYKTTTKKVTMYFGSNSPSNYSVKASTVKNLVDLNNFDNIIFSDLSFKGANENTFDIYSADNIIIKNTDILFSGKNGILAQSTNKLNVENCNIFFSNAIGIFLFSATHSSIIRGNSIKNTGIHKGMGQNGPNTSIGLRVNGDNNLIEYNIIDSSGYCGIRFTGDGTIIKNNLISHFALTKDDAGGIYTGAADGLQRFGRKIIGNIVLNGIGAKEGTTATTVQQVSGLYLDNYTSGVEVVGNTVANCGKLGLYVHNAYNLSISGNTLYNNTGQVMLNHDSRTTVRNVNLKNNIFFSKRVDQPVGYYYTKLNDITQFGKIDSNFYCRPMDDNLTIIGIIGLYTSTAITTKYTLATWKLKYNHDAHSKKSPKTFASTANPDDYFRFEYNASKNSKQISLDATYIDVKNKSYSGTITLAPYSSIVLIKSGPAQSPLPEAKPVVTITSPIVGANYTGPASIRLIATASVTGATISTVDFYNGSTLLKSENLTPFDWSWKNVPPGTYTITAKANASNGTSTTSTAVIVTVKAAVASASMLDPDISVQMNTASGKKLDFKLYPNPAVNKLRVEFNQFVNHEAANLIIRNLSGSAIKTIPLFLSGNFIDVDVTLLRAGMYILNLSGKSFTISKNFTKIY